MLITDGRYGLQAAEQLAGAKVTAEVLIAGGADQAERARDIVGRHRLPTLGLEAAHVSWARQQSLAADWFPGVELVSTVGLVEGLRQVKDAGELARLAAAARIADEALDHVRPQLRSGPHRGSLRQRPGLRDAEAGRQRPVVRDHRGQRSQRGHAPPPPRVARHPAGGARGDRLRRPL